MELYERGIPFVRQHEIKIYYKGRNVGVERTDLIIDDMLIIELKAVDALAPIHTAQLLSYLRVTKYPLGLLINFNVETLKDGVRRVVLSSPRSPYLSPSLRPLRSLRLCGSIGFTSFRSASQGVRNGAGRGGADTGVRDVDLHGDDAAGDQASGGQSRAGVPGFRRAGFRQGSGGGGDLRRSQPVRAEPRRPAPAQCHRRGHGARRYGREIRPRQRGNRDDAARPRGCSPRCSPSSIPATR